MPPQIEVKGFKMYPNPAYGDEVYITTELNGAKEIQVFDIFGEIVLRDKITTNTLNISRYGPWSLCASGNREKKNDDPKTSGQITAQTNIAKSP